MDAEFGGAREAATVSAPAPESPARASSPRAVASKAAGVAGGGVALVFHATSSDSGSSAQLGRLRAAAGFASARAARDAASSLLSSAPEEILADAVRHLAPLQTTGERGAGGLTLFPLLLDGRAA